MSEVGQSVPFGTLFEVHSSDGESERSASPILIQLYPYSTTDDEDIAHFYDILNRPENNIYDRVEYDSDGNYHSD